MTKPSDTIVGRVALWVAAATILVVAATILLLALPAISPRFREQSKSHTAYKEGEQIDVDPTLYRSSPQTLFFFSRFSCGACQASKPFAAALIAALRRRPGVDVVFVTGHGLPDEERSFAAELGFRAEEMYPTDLGQLRVRQVPTTLLVDSWGSIQIVREGMLTENDSLDILQVSSTPIP